MNIFPAWAATCPLMTDERELEVLAVIEFLERMVADPDGRRLVREEFRRLRFMRCQPRFHLRS